MKKQWAVAGAIVLGALGGWNRVTADELADRLSQLEQRQNVLERKYEVDQENAANKAKDTALANAGGKDGFGVKSPDGAFVLKWYGDVQADGRFFLKDGSHGVTSSLTDTFLLRRLRPGVEVTLNKWITGRLQPNFGNGGATLDDAYANLAFRPAAQLRVGRFKPPVGLENLRSSARLTFVERALPTGLVPNYDLGVQLWGELGGGRAAYAVSATNGAADGANIDGADTTDRKDFAARVFLTPLKNSPNPSLAGLGVGLAGSTGRQVGSASSPGLTAGYKTHGQNTFFAYQGRAVADGNSTRWSPQLTWFSGPWALLGEHVTSRQAVRSTVTLVTADLIQRSWQVAASYVLTGEDATDKGVKPRHPYEPGNPGWGAWEIAARFAQFTAGRSVFDKVGANTSFASAAASARSARSFSAGLNWYATQSVKWQTDFETTSFDGGATGGNRPVERALLTRIQLSY